MIIEYCIVWNSLTIAAEMSIIRGAVCIISDCRCDSISRRLELTLGHPPHPQKSHRWTTQLRSSNGRMRPGFHSRPMPPRRASLDASIPLVDPKWLHICHPHFLIRGNPSPVLPPEWASPGRIWSCPCVYHAPNVTYIMIRSTTPRRASIACSLAFFFSSFLLTANPRIFYLLSTVHDVRKVQ